MLSKTQVKLINELCDYVEKNVAPKNFNMGNYRNDPYTFDQAISIQELTKANPDPNICGTAGCMIGHAPVCHPELHKGKHRWLEVSEAYCDSESEGIWGFMFGAHWEDFQNTPKGSVERIRLALEYDAKGLTNGQWNSIMEDVVGDESMDELKELLVTECGS